MSVQVRDLIERVVLTVFTLWLAWRIGEPILAGQISWVNALVLVGELMVLVFAMIRRPAKEVSVSLREWLLAFSASAFPLLIQPGGAQMAPTTVIAALFAIGIIASIAAKLSLNRSFGIVPANRGVVTTGLYSIVRHPVYASYLIGHVAFLMANPTWWNLAIYVAAFALQLARMLSEEALLSRDPVYAEYRQVVRHRLVPGVF